MGEPVVTWVCPKCQRENSCSRGDDESYWLCSCGFSVMEQPVRFWYMDVIEPPSEQRQPTRAQTGKELLVLGVERPGEAARAFEAASKAFAEYARPPCPDCKDTGWYTGLNERRPCPTCRGGS